jgi:cellulose synthase/poly-beta-1,6-N-acetylglucosamine synthase-like glycosyltransferase/spore germination protein YaaH/peptidoglycan/xylan/chitin deacetylase (PgdA/CDA1 family)
MNNGNQIFQTEKPARWLTFKWTTRVIGIGLLFITFIVILGIIYGKTPSLPNRLAKAKYYANAFNPDNKLSFNTNRNKKYKGFKDFLMIQEKKDSAERLTEQPARLTNASLIRAAFYTPWSAKQALEQLEKSGDALNTIFPEWFFIDTVNFTLQTRIDSAGLAMMRIKGLNILPMLSNFNSGKKDFDGDLLHKILGNPAKCGALIKQITDSLVFYRFQGINIDFEEINESGNEALTEFVKLLREQLQAKNMMVTMDVPPNNEDYDYTNLSRYNDFIILMAYDQYNNTTGPGPISSQKWIEEMLDRADNKIDPGKIILGIAGYGRDWINDGESTYTEDLGFQEAIDAAKVSNAHISFDNSTYNAYYSYSEIPEKDTTDKLLHTVYFTDAATIFNICRFSDDYKTAGTAIWHLGSVDPRVWKFYGRNLSTESLQQNPFDFHLLETLTYDKNQKPTAKGEGELLKVLFTPANGKISLETDTEENLVAEENYEQLPSGYIYEKFAEDKTPPGQGHKIVLTFDDGPDPVYTPEILDILEKEKVPATFFVVGLQVEKNIPLLQRIYKDGFEIGNHTFTHSNVAKMNVERAKIEMKATRMLIESITNHSTILFRAPYNADSEPQTYEEIEPIYVSQQENYITVGESVDPNDWDEKITADSIVSRVIRIVERDTSSIILLHDAGGAGRQATVEALPRIIHYFKNKGEKFTTVADLLGKSKDDVMPPVKNSFYNKLDFFFAEFNYWMGNILFALFIVGIGMSVGRMLVMGILAYMQKIRERNRSINHSQPLVSIIIPAFNEELNAVRTVNSLLQQQYPRFEIVFVDDGSNDNTFTLVQQAFENNPHVRVFSKPNGGKSSALNFGIGKANADFVVCIDADTQLKQDAVAELMKKFSDMPKGSTVAVAGNVKVGNERNMITRWQSIEYITAQNFDRRAFDLLNCIIVVPGAIGAFKKEAILAAGGFTTDTLAEDCDLSIRLLRGGGIIQNCSSAISYTEAPENYNQFIKQRFRWSYGVMQCFWKHKDTLFNRKYGNLGWVAMPNILFFQIILPFLAPLADIVLLLSILAAGLGIIPASISHILFYYLIFTVVDMAGAVLAFSFEKEKYSKLFWIIPQRFIYRQLMYFILYKSFKKAIKGEMQIWGVLKRTGNVKEISVTQ